MNLIAQILLWTAAAVSLYFAVFWFLVLFGETLQPKRRQWCSFPLLTVIIPAYNEEDCIRETMESVLAVDYPKNKLQLVVVNDGSKDCTEKIARDVAAEQRGRDITIISQPNKGKGAALNAGLKLAKGEFFATMDSDSVVYPNAPKILLSYFTEKSIAAVVPAMKVRTPKTILQKLQWYEYNVNMFYKDLMGRVDALHVIPGPFPVYRTKIVKNIGGFDETGNLTEDLEFTLRLQSKHYRIVQISDAVVETHTPQTLKAFYAQRNRWFKGALLNAIAYRRMAFNKNYGDFGMIQMPTLLVSGALALILITTGAYYSLKPYVLLAYHLAFVNFDFFTLLKNLTFDISIFDFDFVSIALVIFMLALSAYIFVKAHRLYSEPALKHGIITAGIFLIAYYLVLGIVWAGVAFDLVRGKRQRW